jgi:DNA-binding transcriptional LysR family regulator
MQPLSWEDLRLFLAAYEARSLSAAAHQLGLGQATLSRRMASLEEQVGHVLFDRTRTGLVPTDAALRLLPHVEAMSAQAMGAHSALQGLEARPEGTVRVAVPEGLAVDLFAPLLPGIARRYPGLRLELLADTRLLDLSRREADLALRAHRPEGGDFLARRLPSVYIGLYASRSVIERLPTPATIDDVPLLQYTADLEHLPFFQWVDQLARGRPPVFRSNSFLVLRAAASAGMGAMALPALQAHQADLLHVPVEVPPMEPIPWYLVVPRPLRSVPRVAAVVELVLEAVTQGIEMGRWPPPGF